MCVLCVCSLGLLSDYPVGKGGTVLDSVCSHLQQSLVYSDGEQDAVYLNHFIGIRWPDNKVHTFLKSLSNYYMFILYAIYFIVFFLKGFHTFVYIQVERRHINLTMFGTFGTGGQMTAMAQGVGQPAAIAAKMILNGNLYLSL